mmetsp:Transcript_105138/g.339088  ORF Transcript_105138/g.339088 Transcript_105138/m.339088 type:complete len:451 (-) Transcript_105138:213-1565(-)
MVVGLHAVIAFGSRLWQHSSAAVAGGGLRDHCLDRLWRVWEGLPGAPEVDPGDLCDEETLQGVLCAAADDGQGDPRDCNLGPRKEPPVRREAGLRDRELAGVGDGHGVLPERRPPAAAAGRGLPRADPEAGPADHRRGGAGARVPSRQRHRLPRPEARERGAGQRRLRQAHGLRPCEAVQGRPGRDRRGRAVRRPLCHLRQDLLRLLRLRRAGGQPAPPGARLRRRHVLLRRAPPHAARGRRGLSRQQGAPVGEAAAARDAERPAGRPQQPQLRLLLGLPPPPPACERHPPGRGEPERRRRRDVAGPARGPPPSAAAQPATFPAGAGRRARRRQSGPLPRAGSRELRGGAPPLGHGPGPREAPHQRLAGGARDRGGAEAAPLLHGGDPGLADGLPEGLAGQLRAGEAACGAGCGGGAGRGARGRDTVAGAALRGGADIPAGRSGSHGGAA